ncbi:hypothetical protein CLOM_g65 [Closterium sp. NIES-68]|nr:hypothetical protein CLOM_g65 [Closterium sp. NIES-68]GJP66538.1 hypothetical protein CLOP_g23460 [Closterium sp. NIES-67]GJP67986.1 hypothetical protein CLOP_g24742 [Closterium sp. NIES-67]
MAVELQSIKGIPLVIGAVDGTHIQITGIDAHRADHFSRKPQYAIQLQLTCDARCVIWDYLIGSPGSAHDNRVFVNSKLYMRLASGEIAP